MSDPTPEEIAALIDYLTNYVVRRRDGTSRPTPAAYCEGCHCPSLPPTPGRDGGADVTFAVVVVTSLGTRGAVTVLDRSVAETVATSLVGRPLLGVIPLEIIVAASIEEYP